MVQSDATQSLSKIIAIRDIRAFLVAQGDINNFGVNICSPEKKWCIELFVFKMVNSLRIADRSLRRMHISNKNTLLHMVMPMSKKEGVAPL